MDPKVSSIYLNAQVTKNPAAMLNFVYFIQMDMYSSVHFLQRNGWGAGEVL